MNFSKTVVILLTGCLVAAMPVAADSSGPRLAAYYDRFLAICGDSTFEWNGFDKPVKRMSGITQVGVGKSNSYALTKNGELLAWSDNSDKPVTVSSQVSYFFAGRSGLFAIDNDNTLLQFNSKTLFEFGENVSPEPSEITNHAIGAAVGDSANYYVNSKGELFVYGLAHRGQYGDGRLTTSTRYLQTASDVIQVVSHTGHALILKQDGTVWGTGGNIYGPLGKHGIGDKAVKWGLIFSDAKSIATGSSHSLAIKGDGSLWIWGRNEGLEPKKIMNLVDTVAAGSRSTIAISEETLWQWNPGSSPKAIMKCENP